MLKLYTIFFDVTIGNDLVNKSVKLRVLINNVCMSIIKNQIFVKKCFFFFITSSNSLGKVILKKLIWRHKNDRGVLLKKKIIINYFFPII